MEQVSYSELRGNLASIMKDISKNRITYRITRRNQDNMIMIAEDDFLAMQETLHVLSSQANIDHVMTSIKEADNKEFVDVEL